MNMAMRGEEDLDLPAFVRREIVSDKLTTKPGQPNSREYDHVNPWSRSRDSSARNIKDACLTCNRSKVARTPEKWGGPSI